MEAQNMVSDTGSSILKCRDHANRSMSGTKISARIDVPIKPPLPMAPPTPLILFCAGLSEFILILTSLFRRRTTLTAFPTENEFAARREHNKASAFANGRTTRSKDRDVLHVDRYASSPGQARPRTSKALRLN
jgi:hypothetical protein